MTQFLNDLGGLSNALTFLSFFFLCLQFHGDGHYKLAVLAFIATVFQARMAIYWNGIFVDDLVRMAWLTGTKLCYFTLSITANIIYARYYKRISRFLNRFNKAINKYAQKHLLD